MKKLESVYVRQVYRKLDDEFRPTTISDDTTGLTDLAISFDGTWQKRGKSLKNGVDEVIELHKGLVIDYCVL